MSPSPTVPTLEQAISSYKKTVTLINDSLLSSVYQIDSNKWFSAEPYGFKTKIGEDIKMMFLPISPNNLTINTNFATNVIPTIYGTVEEHSEVRYFDISIEGTTGFVPKYAIVFDEEKNDKNLLKFKMPSRGSYSVSSNKLGGFFPKTLSLINQIKNKAADIFGSEQAKSGIPEIGKDNIKVTGYYAFHNLYRFLMLYKQEAASGLIKEPLIFFNYKDNLEYHVSIKNFILRRSADNPMLYNYSIQMLGYNLKTLGSSIKTGEDDLSKRIKDLGLDGVESSSIFAKIRSAADAAKSTAYAAVALTSSVGK